MPPKTRPQAEMPYPFEMCTVASGGLQHSIVHPAKSRNEIQLPAAHRPIHLIGCSTILENVTRDQLFPQS
jgi:hypothetical protein